MKLLLLLALCFLLGVVVSGAPSSVQGEGSSSDPEVPDVPLLFHCG